MTTETQETTTLTANDPAVGSTVQIRHDLTNEVDAPHKSAGLHGVITGRDPLGGYMVKVGNQKPTRLFRADFIVTSAPSAEQLDSANASTPSSATTAAEPEPIRLVNAHPLDAINSTTNPRRRRGLDLDSLRALADSILQHGLGNPILVRPLPAGRVVETSGMDPRPAYEVIAGERRWRAAQLAELSAMPMFVRHMDDRAVLEMQLVENIEREDLDPMEEAEGFALLRDELGYTVEQIAERMGKGRGTSYVRKRMKLLDLTPASREAMYDGVLQLSTGLAVAHYPAETQAKAVKIIKAMEATGTDGRRIPAPFRTVVLELYRKLNTLLKTAAFDTQDPGLVFNAGPCSTCPKRSQAAADLFAESRDAGDDSCLDTACWESKKAAHVQRVHADAKARGLEVIDGAEAAKLVPSPHSSYVMGYTPLTATAYTELGDDETMRVVTYEDALRAQGRKAPKPVIVINPHTNKAVEMIPDEVAQKLVPTEGDDEGDKPGPKGAPPPHAAPVPEEHRALRHLDVRRALFYRLFDGVRNRPRTVEDLRLAAIAIMCQTEDAHPHVEAFMGWEEAVDADEPEEYLREKIGALDADQLGQLITMAAMEQALDWYTGNLYNVEQEAAFFEAQGIDVLAVRDKVLEDLERQQAAAGGGGSAEGDEQDEDAEEAA
ncbi:ParB/RepB/Spo0J family partition protein [Hydrogenophaga taeniospiralis]|uniref:ParB/RepB/Spo0J family partition protein n=1 Tax=Hydrogenophaga taeniospiralis TaxID=65656 RepID=UPI0021F607D6|nr:ParB/RepB/Spo0J family partition protein [Hydrogenophaga taeniospiralis]MCB4365434.1 ParB/RepB/Spo0J family partition protein [Hydrogenophaga taeniospiralis]